MARGKLLFTDAVIAEATKMFQRGCSSEQIADAFGTTVGSMRFAFNRRGLKFAALRPPPAPVEEVSDEAPAAPAPSEPDPEDLTEFALHAVIWDRTRLELQKFAELRGVSVRVYAANLLDGVVRVPELLQDLDRKVFSDL